MKAEQFEIERLRNEVAKLKAEREILKPRVAARLRAAEARRASYPLPPHRV